MPDLKDFRVLFAYINAQGQDRYEFTTVLAADETEAATQLAGPHRLDYGFRVIQVVASNGEATGFTDTDRETAIAQAKENLERGLHA